MYAFGLVHIVIKDKSSFLWRQKLRMTHTSFKQLYQEFQESNLSVRDFCSNQALSPSTFYSWKKQLGNTTQEKPNCFVQQQLRTELIGFFATQLETIQQVS